MIDRTPLSYVAAFITVLYSLFKNKSFNFVVYIYK